MNGKKGTIRWGLVCIVFFASFTLLQAEIDSPNQYAWSENAGWQNWLSTSNPVPVTVSRVAGDGSYYLSGYVWEENNGWFKLGADAGGPYANTASTNWGINMTSDGVLSGYAWSENAGWINFNSPSGGVTMAMDTGDFDGYAWSESVGWINMNGTATNGVTYLVRNEQAATTVSNWPTASAITYGQAHSNSMLSGGSASVDGTFAFTSLTNKPDAGSSTPNVTFTPDDAANYLSVTGEVSLTVNQFALSVTGAVAQSKSYDGTISATISGGGLSGVLGSDDVTLANATTGTFAQISVGSNIVVTSYMILAGSAMGNYSLPVQPSLSANITKADQTITFTNPGAQETTNEVSLSATATSGLTVTLTNTGPGVLSGTDLTFTNSGTVVVYANQAGNSDWNAAPVSNVSITVTKAVATVNLAELSKTYNGSAQTASATTVPIGQTVNLTYNGLSAGPTNAGNYTVIGLVAETMYQGGSTGTMTIAKASQTISFPNPGSQYVTNAVELTATGGATSNAITFSVLSGPASISDSTNLTFSGAGTVIVTADQLGNANYDAAPTKTNSFLVSPVLPAIDTPVFTNVGMMTSDLGATVTATNGASVTERGVFWGTSNSFEIATATRVSETGTYGNGRFSVTATNLPTGSTAYYRGFAVNSAGTNLTSEDSFLTIPAPPVTLPATNIQPFSLAVNWMASVGATNYYFDFSSTMGYMPGYSNLLVGDVTTLVVTGLQLGASYGYRLRAENATGISTSTEPKMVSTAGGAIVLTPPAFTFTGTYQGSNPAEQTWTIQNTGSYAYDYTNAITYGTGATNAWLSCGASGNSPIGSVQTWTGQVDMTSMDVGTYYATNTIYAAVATNAPIKMPIMLTIGKATQTVDFPTIGKQKVTNSVVLEATASSGLPVTFHVLSGPGVITGGTNLTFTDRGTAEVKAYQAGDSNWNSALSQQSIRVYNSAVYLDFDGDEKADITVYWPESGLWYILQSATLTERAQAWGWANSQPVPGDYDGDGIYDVAVYNDTTGFWYIYLSETQTSRLQNWGWLGALPVQADYDGDGTTDIAVYDPATGNWIILESSTKTTRTQNWGWYAALPVPGDYDGDGKADIAIYWPEGGVWNILQSSTDTGRTQPWGWEDAVAMPGDYDGDEITDIAVYWPDEGWWYILQSSDGQSFSRNWGWSAALPVPADYDGDIKWDTTVDVPTEGTWYLWQTQSQSSRIQPWGWDQVVPVN